MKRAKGKPERITATVSGRVQGVFFRAWACETAQRLKLCGWVRNREDGGVEVVAEGPREVLEELIQLCWSGPPAAEVQNIQTHWEEAQGLTEGFTIRH